jgi:hypothetical protein
MGGESAATPNELTMLDWALGYARAGFRVRRFIPSGMVRVLAEA